MSGVRPDMVTLVLLRTLAEMDLTRLQSVANTLLQSLIPPRIEPFSADEEKGI